MAGPIPAFVLAAALQAASGSHEATPVSVLGHAMPVASPDGRHLAVGCDDGSVRIVDLEREVQVALLAGHAAKIRLLAFDSGGERLASADDDGRVRVWNTRPPAPAVDFDEETTRSRSGVQVVLRRPSNMRPGAEKTSHGFPLLAFQPGGDLLLVRLGPGVSVWNAVQGCREARISFDQEAVEHAAWGPDMGRVFDARTGSETSDIPPWSGRPGTIPETDLVFTCRRGAVEIRGGERLRPILVYTPLEGGAWRIDRHAR
jgi:WD40 repeat protein